MSPPDTAPGLDAASLLGLARAAVARRLGLHSELPAPPEHPALRAPGACFVTLRIDERLRGCIGSIEAYRALAEDLRHNACGAAFRDPRFPPLEASELPRVRFSVSVLGPRSPLHFADEADARAQLRPGRDGLVLVSAGHRGVFLPQVWDQLPSPRDFLDQLKRKAGLPTSHWSSRLTLERFEVRKFSEPPGTHGR